MKWFRKKRVEIRLDVYEDGRAENRVTGDAKGVVIALAHLLCAVCIDCKVDGVSRGELRQAIAAQVEEIFDDVWRVKNLGGELE